MKKFFILLIAVFSLCSCSNDDSNSEISIINFIPNGTYVQVNGTSQESASIVINGDCIRWTCFGSLRYHNDIYNYKLFDDTMIILQDDYIIAKTTWSMDGNYLTIGDIIYFRQTY